MLTQGKDIYITPGVAAPAYLLTPQLWDELQASSVDAAQAPADFVSFSDTCLFFAAIFKKGEGKEAGIDVDSDLELLSDPTLATGLTSTTIPGAASLPWEAKALDLPGYDTADDELDLISDSWAGIDEGPSSHPREFELFPPHMLQGRKAPPQIRPEAIGVVYLTSSSQGSGAPAGEVNIGVILSPPWRERGWARQAVELVMQWAFEEIGFHRVQAAVLDSPNRGKVLSLFTQLGFGHEGTRRRSVYSARDGMWKDVTYLAVLDTEWLMRGYFKPAPKSLWDEMFLRHTREREELLQWEERTAKLKRTTSMDTVRETSETPSVVSRSSSFAAFERDVSESADLHAEDKGKRREDRHSNPFDDRSSTSSSPRSSHSSLFYDAASAEPSIHEYTPTPWPRLQPRGSRSTSSASASSVQSSRSLGSELPLAPSPASSRWELLDSSDTSSSFESIGHSDMESDFE